VDPKFLVGVAAFVAIVVGLDAAFPSSGNVSSGNNYINIDGAVQAMLDRMNDALGANRLASGESIGILHSCH